jgi:aldehyde dehydrogenase (NAD+)
MESSGPSEIERIFALQSKHKWQVKQSSAAERKAKLSKLRDIVQRDAEFVQRALYQDLRKPTAEGAGEVSSVISDIDDALAHIEEWMAPSEIKPAAHFPGAKARVTYEARGVCLLFGPWNFPFQLLLEPLVPIIAAGNCAILKPNELAPETSKISAQIIREAFDIRDVAVVEGGIELAQQLLQLPFDHIFFTGSPKVGRSVMGAAAKHLASVTLELGGKCPVIIDRDADLAAVAATVVAARCYNAGQVCLCPDIAWIPAQLQSEFLAHLRKCIETTYYPKGTLDKTVFGKIVDARNFERVKGYLDDALGKGATLVIGGETEREDRTIHPTVLADVPLDAKLMNEEIFGPILSVASYTDVSDVYEFTQRLGKPLAMYIFSNREEFISTLLQNTSSGGVTINGWAMHWFEPQLPFGGVNESGHGAYHGIHGFRELSHERSVFVQP